MKKVLLITAVILGLTAGPLAAGPAFAETAPVAPTETSSPTATPTDVPLPTGTVGSGRSGSGRNTTATATATPTAAHPLTLVGPTPTPTVEPTPPPTPTPTPTPTTEPTPPPVVAGPIAAKWTALKGAAGALGAPTGNQLCSSASAARRSTADPSSGPRQRAPTRFCGRPATPAPAGTRRAAWRISAIPSRMKPRWLPELSRSSPADASWPGQARRWWSSRPQAASAAFGSQPAPRQSWASP